MHFHWLRDKETQTQLKVVWERGRSNKTDYFTKHFLTVHHRQERAKYVRDVVNHIYSTLRTQIKKDY